MKKLIIASALALAVACNEGPASTYATAQYTPEIPASTPAYSASDATRQTESASPPEPHAASEDGQYRTIYAGTVRNMVAKDERENRSEYILTGITLAVMLDKIDSPEISNAKMGDLEVTVRESITEQRRIVHIGRPDLSAGITIDDADGNGYFGDANDAFYLTMADRSRISQNQYRNIANGIYKGAMKAADEAASSSGNTQ